MNDVPPCTGAYAVARVFPDKSMQTIILPCTKPLGHAGWHATLTDGWPLLESSERVSLELQWAP